jgi:hypothetical protein
MDKQTLEQSGLVKPPHKSKTNWIVTIPLAVLAVVTTVMGGLHNVIPPEYHVLLFIFFSGASGIIRMMTRGEISFFNNDSQLTNSLLELVNKQMDNYVDNYNQKGNKNG